MRSKHYATFICTILLVLLTNVFALSQKKSNVEKYFKNYNPSQISLIKDHWKQYFKEDIFTKLNDSIAVFPIGFDSFGGIYPNDSLFAEFESRNFAGGIPSKKEKRRNLIKGNVSDNNLNKYSMFQMFEWSRNTNKLETAISKLQNKSDRYFYSKTLKDYSFAYRRKGRKLKKQRVKYNQYIDSFYQKWDAYHLSKTSRNLWDKIEAEQPDRILFFVHGYNVPYSLAVVQSIEITKLISKIQEESGKKTKILLVPIYWSSNAQKKHNFKDLDDININNEKKISNAIKFTYYSNRAYFAGLGLRSLIVEMEKESKKLPELYLFSHSLGATTATTLVINTSSKLHTKYSKQILENKKNNDPIDKGIKDNLEKSENVNYKLIQKFKSVPFPKSKIRIFLSAPAIGGLNTFVDMEDELKSRVSFFSTVNKKDEMLNKFIGMVYKLGVTSLGINKDNDALITHCLYFSCTSGGYFFYNKDFMSHKAHSIFEYIEYPEYNNMIEQFWTFKFPDE